MLAHDYFSVKVCCFYIKLESFLLKVFYHSYISLFECTDAQLKHFKLFPEFPKEFLLSLSEERVYLSFMKLLLIGSEDGFEKI